MRQRSRAQRAAYANRQRRERLRPERSILAAVSLSAAQREQGEVNVTDLALAARAQLAHPGVRWWWGERLVGDRRGAYCYLCGELITPGTVRAPFTLAAQRAILAHRDSAHVGSPLPPGSEPPATLAGADQSEESPS